jgi:glycosyltransferase involved in cell wall biosynthesis
MHILILSTGYPTEYVPLDGIFFRDQAEALADENHQVGFIAVNPISIKSVIKKKKWDVGYFNFRENGVDTFIYKYINIPKYPTYCVKKSLRIGIKLFKKYIKTHGKPEIIHVHCFESGALANEIKQKYGIPYVITEHSTKFGNDSIPTSMKKFARLAFENSDANIAVSKEFSKLLTDRYKREFIFIPNIVNTSQFNIDKHKNTDTFVFFNAGGLNDNKNHDMLLTAFAVFLKEHSKALLKIAGGGPNEKALKELAVKLSINEKVHFLGEISRTKLQTEMQSANVFVLSSKIETFGVVLIEALSCGLPVVATECGGPETIIVNSDYGELCKQNLESFVLAMKKVYLKYNTYNPEILREYITSNFSNHAVAIQLESVYKTILLGYEK